MTCANLQAANICSDLIVDRGCTGTTCICPGCTIPTYRNTWHHPLPPGPASLICGLRHCSCCLPQAAVPCATTLTSGVAACRRPPPPRLTLPSRRWATACPSTQPRCRSSGKPRPCCSTLILEQSLAGHALHRFLYCTSRSLATEPQASHVLPAPPCSLIKGCCQPGHPACFCVRTVRLTEAMHCTALPEYFQYAGGLGCHLLQRAASHVL